MRLAPFDTMFQNYIKTALRNLRRHKAHAAINIAGLTIGMAVALSIGIWVADELNYNKSIPRYDRIGQVMQASVMGGDRGVAWGSPHRWRRNCARTMPAISGMS